MKDLPQVEWIRICSFYNQYRVLFLGRPDLWCVVQNQISKLWNHAVFLFFFWENWRGQGSYRNLLLKRSKNLQYTASRKLRQTIKKQKGGITLSRTNNLEGWRIFLRLSGLGCAASTISTGCCFWEGLIYDVSVQNQISKLWNHAVCFWIHALYTTLVSEYMATTHKIS